VALFSLGSGGTSSTSSIGDPYRSYEDYEKASPAEKDAAVRRALYDNFNVSPDGKVTPK